MKNLFHRKLFRLLMALGLAISLSFVGAGSASAWDSGCSHTRFSDSKVFTAYVLREGVGVVAWRTYVTPDAHDLCSHGDLRVYVGFYNAGVKAKQGNVYTQGAFYQVSGSSKWYTMHRIDYDDRTIEYNTGSHLDLLPQWRVTNIVVYTYLNFGGDAYAPRSYSCNLISHTCG